MASPQKVKGKSYENAKAKFLTDIFGQTFIRVPTSGAFLGGKNYDRRLDMSDGQVMAFKGDIIPPDDWKFFNCECKFYIENRKRPEANVTLILKSLVSYALNFKSWIKLIYDTADICNFVINGFKPTFEFRTLETRCKHFY